ncbi:B12-binding domain-containing protein [Limnohabitans sp. Rim8]|uniref:cobalamin B12-binding domain-containing protein n=1 Tax=Limnohabitans sp. Rim8 TaxID=1100718 RepID=UPI00260BC8DD|nr:cobalamin B12-binding domain-containing protein [Limnohabitans sp. Rim8]
MSSLGQSLTHRAMQPQNADSSNGQDECKRSLTEVIETQIIPRLVQAHRIDLHDANAPTAGPGISPKQLATFVALSKSSSASETTQFIDELLHQGVTTDRIFLELIAPAARQLGLMWEQDLCDFTEVTCGLVRMHEITHRLGFEYQNGPQLGGDVQRIMLASAPGSQHFLGMTIVSDFFRKAGWDVVIEISLSEKELMHAVNNEWFDVIGISCATEAQLKTLPGLIRALKSSSGNPEPGVLLGGPIFTLQQHDARSLGADGICIDVKEAVALAASFRSSPSASA